MAPQSPKLRAIPAEAVQEADEWFSGKLLALLNGYFADAGNAFDHLLGQNTRRQVATFTATTDSGGVFPERAVAVQLPTRPTEVRVSAFPTSTAASRTFDLGQAVWSLNQRGEVVIYHVPGLEASTEYRFTVVLEA